MTNIHSLPPSASVLVALSTLEPPPSPILDPIDASCSSDFIPILFDFVLEEEDEVNGDELTPMNQRVSVGTFGPRYDLGSLAHRSLPSNNSILSNCSSRVHAPIQHTPPRAVTPSVSTLSAISANTTASLSPSPSNSSTQSLHRKFRFPRDLSFGFSTSKSLASQVSQSDSRNLLPIPASEPRCIPGVPYNFDHFPVPEAVIWLKNMTIALSIDQEGFRSVCPTFKLAGFRQHVRGWGYDAPEGGWALFRPTTKESFPFHYAPLEGLPILRRLMINNDESRDYISRQATLALKTTGVYIVHGSESFHSLPTGVQGQSVDGKMRWRFEYFVDNKVDESGKKIVDGEKQLTPLTFLCSPWLLHPSHGHKVKFMHVVKKSVTTKLVAERLELPLKTVGNAMWSGFHRRGNSHASAEEAKSNKRKGSIRRGGMRSRANENTVYGHQNTTSTGVGRHIIPPADFLKMMAVD
ncbi:hypothetical protein MIND_00496900 [Mycena indigotica]|uniref:Uncharacterized protein n=1 Tax=Mycena indigotica TaxID=2126181 RepID=A0A8H6W9W0_9AGAR|nr:uncharacterized protein MIND_00496900 [Mycena indigotica]KAF7307038.1 hypothetical protein MIND_00496900 [Mycena indigotica]